MKHFEATAFFKKAAQLFACSSVFLGRVLCFVQGFLVVILQPISFQLITEWKYFLELTIYLITVNLTPPLSQIGGQPGEDKVG